jgi:DNA-binding YbaB/EbfC family protein
VSICDPAVAEFDSGAGFLHDVSKTACWCREKGGALMNMMKMMREVQQAQSRLKKVQEEFTSRKVEGQSGGGVVKVTVNGDGDVLGISISPEAVDPSDIGMLEDLILSAVQSAQENAHKMMKDEMGKVAGGLNIPGLT